MTTPNWLNREKYPFTPHYLEVDGGRMHYVDEGSGPPLVLVHGTPTWSFMYRKLIKRLSTQYRVIAPDHLGFGLSDKPVGWGYRLEDQGRNLQTLIEKLGLKNIVLAVHDFGGPIGLSYALTHPENISKLILFNTWLWSLADNPSARYVGKFFSGKIGEWLYKRFNFSPKVLVKMAVGDRSQFSQETHRHYIEAFPTPESRHAPWMMACHLIGSSAWYDSLWAQRDKIKDKPALIIWGLKDPSFKLDALERWRALFTAAQIVELPGVGHLVAEEAGPQSASAIQKFLVEQPQVTPS